MTQPRTRIRMVGLVFAIAAAMSVFATAAYATVGVPAGLGTELDETLSPSGPGEEPTVTPSEPGPSEEPGGVCGLESVEPTSTPSAVSEVDSRAVGWGAVARRAVVGPITCQDRTSIVTVDWDGKALKIVIKPTNVVDVPCTLTKVTVTPKEHTINKDGSISVPYGNAKITVEVTYTWSCPADGLTTLVDKTLTVEFTPPKGPVEIKQKHK